MPAGRPLKFKSVEELQKKIDAYFDSCTDDKGEKPVSITGLALALDTYRDVLIDYETKYGDEYSNAIKKAKQRVQNAYEIRTIKRGAAGDIFALKNFGWSDKTEVENSFKDVKAININFG